MSEIYRDGLAGLRSQVATKRAALDDRQKQLPPLVRALLPAELREALDGESPPVDEDDMASLTAAEAALDALLGAHDEAIALSSKVRRCPDTVADPPSPNMPPPWLIEESWHLELRRVLEPRISMVDGDAYIVRWGDFTYLARMRRGFEPLAYVVRFEPESGAFSASVRTSVPERLPRLEVRPERVYHGVGRALHLAQEMEVGDCAFDERFWITGDRTSATLLDAEVRARLLAIHARGPVLTIDGGVAELAWSGELRHASRDLLPGEAIDAVLGLRATIERA